MANSATQELKNLSPSEKEYALKILEELQKNGNSKLYEDLIYSDYKEIPTDIITFIKDNKYLGKAWHLPNGKCKLFPFWEKKLKELFPDNIHTNYNTFIESGARGLGKAQPLTANVLTPKGFKQMGDIKAGDEVIGVDGIAHVVTDVFYRGEKDIYSVTFEDGTSTECCDEHLWEVWDRTITQREVLELKEIIPNYKNRKYLIPLCAPVGFEEQYLQVHPYVIGIIFACGFMLDGNLAITTSNKEIINRVVKELSKTKCKLVGTNKDDTYIIVSDKKTNPYIDFFITNNISFSSGTKRIPDILKHNSISARLNFLSGVLDIIGTVNYTKKTIEIVMQCGECADELAWMVRSLGGLCTKTERTITTQISRKLQETTVKNDYFISIKLSNNLLLTSVNKEFDKCVVVDKYKVIKEIKYVGKKECKCILVDYPRHLYITDDFIVTHNSEIAVTVALYMMHRLMCMKNPHQTLNLKPTEKIAFAFMNITQKLAEEIGVSKFQETVQVSPWFMDRGTITGRTTLIWNPPDFINIIIGSQSSDVIGQPIYFAFFDEVSFQKNKDVEMQKKKAMDMVDTAVGGMKTRFTNRGKNPTLLTLASSKRSEVSFLETYIKKKMDSESTLIVDEPVWNVRPASEYSGKRFFVALGNRFLNSDVLPEDITEIELDIYRGRGYKILSVPIEYIDKFKDDVDRALCDYAGISSSELTTYISGVRLMDCVNENIENPFTKEILEIGNNPTDTAQYYDFFDLNKIPAELKSRPLYIHLDMSVTGDKTGIGGVWIVNKKSNHIEGQPDSQELFYRVAFCVAIKAPKGYQVSYEKNRQFIYWLKDKGFNIKGVSSDSYQSADMLQQMRSKNFEYDIISVDRVSPNDHVCLPYAAFKSAIYEKRIEFYKHNLLIEEITGLEKNSSTGKVDHSPNSINCLAGDTKISLLDGREVTIKELVDEYNQGKENYVYTVNEQEHKIEPKLIENAFCSGHNAQLIEITLDNGEIIKCTPEHRFMLRNGVYCEAKDLLPNDSLMPLYRKYPNKGGLSKYRMYYEPFEDEWHFEHRQFALDVYDTKYLVHHKNCNPSDNSPSNLIWMSKEAHVKIHADMQTGAQSPEAKEKRSKSVKDSHYRNRTDPEYWTRFHPEMTPEEAYNKHLEIEAIKNQKIKNIESTFNVKYSDLSKEEKQIYAINYYNLQKGYDVGKKSRVNKKREELANFFDVDYSTLSEHERRSLSIKYARESDPTYQQRVSEAVSNNHSLGKYENAHKAIQECNEKKKMLKLLFPEIDREKFKEFFNMDYDSIPATKRCGWINRYRQQMYDLVNHKVVSIKYLDVKEDVYDLTIQDNHNFALSCGIFVHNSKDVSDGVCGAMWNASQHSEEFSYDFGEDIPTMLNVSGTISEETKVRNQVSVDFEQEMQKLLDPLGAQVKKNNDIKNSLYNPTYLSNGIIVW